MIKEVIDILKPISIWIDYFQNDSAPISTVYHCFLELPKNYRKLELSDPKKKYLEKLIKQRFDFIYGDAHGLGYILDPRYIGEEMDLELRLDIEEFLYEHIKFGKDRNR